MEYERRIDGAMRLVSSISSLARTAQLWQCVLCYTISYINQRVNVQCWIQDCSGKVEPGPASLDM